MTASLHQGRQENGAGVPAGGAAREERVSGFMSVSPNHAYTAPTRAKGASSARTDALADGVMLSPRVVDEQAFNELGNRLSAIIAEASAVADKLNESAARSSADASRADAASVHLQERLRLGARMLKAFAAQIARVDELTSATDQRAAAVNEAAEAATAKIAELERRADSVTDACAERIRACEAAATGRLLESATLNEGQAQAALARAAERACARLDERLSQLDARLNAAVDAALERLDAHLARRREQMEQIERQIDQVLPQANSLLSIVEGAEANATKLVQRCTEVRTATDAKLAELESAANRVEDVRQGLAQELRRCETGIAGASDRLTALRTTALGLIEHCEGVEARLKRRLDDAVPMLDLTSQAQAAGDALRGLLAQLKPWESWIVRDDAVHGGAGQGSMPPAVAKLIEDVRGAVRDDLAHVAMAMRRAAASLEGSATEATTPALASHLAEPREPANVADIITTLERDQAGETALGGLRLRSMHTGA